MKKYLPQMDRITLAAAGLGMLLRLWLLLVGEDHKALYPANHISWILLMLLSAALLIFLFLLVRFAGKSRFYGPNFPASLPGAVGFALAGMGMLVTAIPGLADKSIFLHTLTAAMGIAAGVALLWGGFSRWRGKKPHFAVFMVPCLYFCLRLFCLGHAWGDEPEMSRFLISFLATAACVLSCWQLWGFSVDLGNRPITLLGSLMAIYLCLVSIPGNGDWLLYLTVAAWLYLNLCRKRAPARRRAPVQPEEAEEAVPEIPATDQEIDRIISEILEQTPSEEE